MDGQNAPLRFARQTLGSSRNRPTRFMPPSAVHGHVLSPETELRTHQGRRSPGPPGSAGRGAQDPPPARLSPARPGLPVGVSPPPKAHAMRLVSLTKHQGVGPGPRGRLPHDQDKPPPPGPRSFGSRPHAGREGPTQPSRKPLPAGPWENGGSRPPGHRGLRRPTLSPPGTPARSLCFPSNRLLLETASSEEKPAESRRRAPEGKLRRVHGSAGSPATGRRKNAIKWRESDVNATEMDT